MVMKKAILLFTTIVLLVSLLSNLSLNVNAIDDKLLQTYFSKDGANLEIFLTQDINEDAQVIIGNDTFIPSELKNGNVEVKTIFLVDNSRSMPKDFRDSIKESILSYISYMSENEQVKIVMFDKEVTTLINEYSSDVTYIEYALSKIDYKGVESYVYDAILETISENYIDEGVYYRTILITDGADRKGNVSFEYLRTEIDRNNIYHIDIVQVSEDGKQETNLKSLSELGSNTYTMFDKNGNLSSLKPGKVSAMRVKLNNSVTTGEYRGVTVKNGSSNISLGSILFPQVELEDEPVSTIEEEPPVESEPVPKKNFKWIFIIGGICLGVILIGVVIFIIIYRVKNKKCAIEVFITKDDNRDIEGTGNFIWKFDLENGYRVGRTLKPTNPDGSRRPENQTAVCELLNVSSIGRNAFEIYYAQESKRLCIRNVAEGAVFSIESANFNGVLDVGNEAYIDINTKILLGSYTTIQIKSIKM